jgi:hypothetical protein
MRHPLAAALLSLILVPHARGLQQAASPPAADPSESAQAVNDRFVRDWSQRIAGHETEPAGRVFKNIRLEWFKNVPASDFLGIMDEGYAKALGVRCTHCHDPQDFSSDARRPKRAAREMAQMHWEINQRLQRMDNLTSTPEDRPINCNTCHRGQKDPHQPGE